ncbi:MAG: branched-chain amino acid transaminase [Candidatus Binatia bacterium]|nr:branched-chain amino acid transaminase [Candidatus Binatia bacterium]
MGKTYHRGKIVDDAEAQLSIRSKAVNYGLGCFGGIRAYWNDAKKELFVFRLMDHIERLYRSALILGLEPPVSEEDAVQAVLDVLRENDARSDQYVRPLIYVDSDELSPTLTDVPVALSIYTQPLGKYFGGDSIHACVSSWRRVSDNAIPARAKPTAAYLNSALARAEAKRNGFDEAIFLTQEGSVSEGSAAHLFIVRRGELVSPPSTEDNLDGITRRSLMELARSEPLSWPVTERKISRTELYTADEVFLCGTAAELTPVTRIDHRPIGNGAIGEWSRALGARFHDVASGNDDAWSSWLTPAWEGR